MKTYRIQLDATWEGENFHDALRRLGEQYLIMSRDEGICAGWPFFKNINCHKIVLIEPSEENQ